MINSCCLVYNIYPTELGEPIKLEELEECENCKCMCSYILYESLAPWMTKLSNNYTRDEDHIILEAKLRQQIVQISRLFDEVTKAEYGTYSKAHYKIINLYADGTRYLKIPEFVKGTLELYKDGYLINPDTYAYKDGLLVLNPCESHTTTCGCTNDCGIYNVKRIPATWRGCLQAKAKFGKECADYAVQMAVTDYLIEHNTFADQKEASFQGYPVTRSFRKPDSWTSLVDAYLSKKRVFNQFAVS